MIFPKVKKKLFLFLFSLFDCFCLFYRKNQLSLYWNFKIGFHISIILITLTSLSFPSTFLENFSSVFLTSVIWFCAVVVLPQLHVDILMHFDFLQFLCYSYPFSSAPLFFSVRLFSPYIFLLLFCEIHVSLNSLEAWDSRIWLCSSFTYLLSVFTLYFNESSVQM